MFVGRDDPAKGLHVLREAWPEATIVTGGKTPEELRNFYARAHVLVVPSLRTRTFREPWGLVVNEAMNQRTAIIASDGKRLRNHSPRPPRGLPTVNFSC